jgi:uracil-DNA glycosylase
MTTDDPFKFTSGDRDAEILIVGEAWGHEEARELKPFVGQAGKELDRMLFDAGLRRNQVLCTNICDARPNLENDFASGFTLPARSGNGIPLRGLLANSTLSDGLEKLERLITALNPRLIIGTGNWPLWALTEHSDLKTQAGYKRAGGIMNWRGSQTYTRPINGCKYPYLPIIHPAAILRDWRLRHITVHDLRCRAARFIAKKTSWDAPVRPAIPAPSYDQARDYLTRLLEQLNVGSERWIAVDIETWQRRSISCIGVATDDQGAICLPAFYFGEDGKSVDYFTLDQEVEITQLLRQVLTHSCARVTNQNIIYDAQYLDRNLGIRLRPSFDTMVGHHLCWPGTPKDLSYLSSLYCDHHLHWKEESEEWDTKLYGHNDLWSYNCKDVLSTLEITHEVRKAISQLKMDELMAHRLDEWELAFSMMRRGVNYDEQMRKQFQVETNKLSDELSEWLLAAMPEDLRYSNGGSPWYAAPIFQQEIFYDKIGIAPVIHKKSKRPTLAAEAFEVIRKRAPWLSPLFDRLELQRSISVFRSHFLSVRLMPNGRYGAGFNIAGTETFRWSSSANAFDEGGNFQNIPKVEEE